MCIKLTGKQDEYYFFLAIGASNRVFPKIDHSVRIVLEQIKFSKKVTSIRGEPSTLGL